MGNPLISTIVPVFNGERYLGEALDSIWAQTYRPLEIIVVNDGSTDGTAKVVGSYRERVQYIQQANKGPAAARNLGISKAGGDFIAFLDADDVWHPEKLERQMARFRARPELNLCVTHIQNFWIQELKAEAEQFCNHPLSQPTPGYFQLQTLLARGSVFDTVGRFNTVLPTCSDVDWFLRVVEHGMVILVLPKVLLNRRLHRTNISRSPAVQTILLRTVGASASRSSAVRDALLQAVKASRDRPWQQDDYIVQFADFLTAYRHE